MLVTSRRMIAVGFAVVAALSVSSCSSSSSSSQAAGSGSSTTGGASGGASGSGACKIALLLPENHTPRYETHDKPEFTAKAQSLGCTVDYQNAGQDANTQQTQATTALNNGDNVLVLDAVDGKAAAKIASDAKAKGVPVIAYDRLSDGPVSFYVSFDNTLVGTLQGQAIVKAMQGLGNSKGNVVMINGDPADPNAAGFKKGATDAITAAGYTIAKSYDTAGWQADTAATEASQAITAVGKDKIVGMYVANDGMAAGVIKSMTTAGLDPKKVPVTGQDAAQDGVQRVLAGTQAMTIYKATKLEAETAAQAAHDLATKATPTSDTTQTNGTGDKVPSVLLKPVSVTKDNVKSTVIADGFWKAADVCTGDAAAACTALGIS